MKTNNNANETNSDYRDEVAQIMTIPRPIVVMSREFPPGHITPFHSHARAQLLYASSGVMTVTTDNGIWVVPPLRAIWIPAHTHHQRKASGLLSIRTLFIQHDYFPDAPSSCCVVAVSTLLKELILYATTIPRLYPLEGASARLMRVILDQIQVMDVKPLSLSIPAQPKLKQ
ncbi:MAG: AraC family ligand binding domain-containing protein, partial [Desulfuromonas sp.]|nr:AraC family ligand binding domain-containing protein [Desulfuromonas sp.]